MGTYSVSLTHSVPLCNLSSEFFLKHEGDCKRDWVDLQTGRRTKESPLRNQQLLQMQMSATEPALEPNEWNALVTQGSWAPPPCGECEVLCSHLYRSLCPYPVALVQDSIKDLSGRQFSAVVSTWALEPNSWVQILTLLFTISIILVKFLNTLCTSILSTVKL